MTIEEMALKLKSLKVSQKFFEEKIRRVEHDLFILNKNPIELIKYPV